MGRFKAVVPPLLAWMGLSGEDPASRRVRTSGFGPKAESGRPPTTPRPAP